MPRAKKIPSVTISSSEEHGSNDLFDIKMECEGAQEEEPQEEPQEMPSFTVKEEQPDF